MAWINLQWMENISAHHTVEFKKQYLDTSGWVIMITIKLNFLHKDPIEQFDHEIRFWQFLDFFCFQTNQEILQAGKKMCIDSLSQKDVKKWK